MTPSTGVIIQARMGSSRLPGKVLLPFYNDKSIFEILLERLKTYFNDDEIIVATTVNSEDDIIATTTSGYDLSFYRGSERDVLDRFIKAAKENKVKKVIRVCADNPFLDMRALKDLFNRFSSASCDYMAFSTSEGVPSIKTHYGLWGEAVTVDALEKIHALTDELIFHEHVTNYIYSNQKIFDIEYIIIPNEIEKNHLIRLTLDTAEDFQVQKDIYAKAGKKGKDFSIPDILQVLDSNPMYYKIMKEQIRKNAK